MIAEQFHFVDNGSTTTMRFRSLVNSTFDGPYLDNLSISAVPLPASLSLLVPGLLGLMRVVRRRPLADPT